MIRLIWDWLGFAMLTYWWVLTAARLIPIFRSFT